MPLVTIIEDHLVPLGTGFMIAPDGLMLTAGHVVDEAVENTRRRSRQPHQYELYAVYASNERHGPDAAHHIGGLWPIDRAWRPAELDVAFCWLRRAIRDGLPIRFPSVQLSPALPTVGSKICGFGYYGMTGSVIHRSSHGPPSVHYHQNTAQTEGIITELYPVRRDSGMLRFPSFQTDARFDPGMSGGPVFNGAGSVCGVICSSLPLRDGDSGHVSFASLIWPALGATIEVALGEGSPTEVLLIHDLVARGFVSVDPGIAKIQVVTNPDGTRTVSLSA